MKPKIAFHSLAFISLVSCSGSDAIDPVNPSPINPNSIDAGNNDSQSMSDAIDAKDVPATDADTPDARDAKVDVGVDAPCDDPCPAPAGGVTSQCQKRFMYGVNYAWHNFASDFGGLGAWTQAGVSAVAQTHMQNLKAMHDHGANVIRWWVFPDFRGDGVTFDGADTPTGLGPTTLSDLQTALSLAEQADVYLMLCLFSFDGFRPTEEVGGVRIPSLKPLIVSSAPRQALLDNVVRPLAATVQASPNRDRMIAWDVINEPEWAMFGENPYGDVAYDPSTELEPVTHATMESFIGEVIKVLRQESSALVTVGSAARKWAHAWSQVDIDFYQFHMYSWINDSWPYTDPPSTYGIGTKPIVMGEFPLGGLTPSDSFNDVVSSWYQNGFAGALGWQYNEATSGELADVKAFADQHRCETQYTSASSADRKAFIKNISGSAAEAGLKSPAPGRRCRVVNGHATCSHQKTGTQSPH